jgi:hypothetical protein
MRGEGTPDLADREHNMQLITHGRVPFADPSSAFGGQRQPGLVACNDTALVTEN